MNLPEIIFIAIALSMDAAAVSLSNGMAYGGKGRKKVLLFEALMFGLFQGVMPVLGFFTGGLFMKHIGSFASVLVCVILCFLGVKMIFDGLHHTDDAIKELTTKVIITQAVATSIDAFAVGIGFNAVYANIYWASAIICGTTFLISVTALALGRYLGRKAGENAVIFGGIILTCVGIKSLF